LIASGGHMTWAIHYTWFIFHMCQT